MAELCAMNWTLLRTVLVALALFELAKTGELFTVGGLVTVAVMLAIIAYKERRVLSRPPRIYPQGQEPDAAEWR